jgi:hypothetical protein
MRQKGRLRHSFSNCRSARLFHRKFEFFAGVATLPQWKHLKRFHAHFAGNFAKLYWIRVFQTSGLPLIAMSAAGLLMSSPNARAGKFLTWRPLQIEAHFA